MSKLEDYKKESREALESLSRIKSEISEDVEDIRVSIDLDNNPQIARSITQVFGEMEENDPRKGFITFEMYMDCLRIIKMAGKAKASAVLEREFI